MPSPTPSSRRTTRIGRSGSSAGAVQMSSAASPAQAGRNRGRRLDRPARGHPRPTGASARGAHRGARGRRAHRAPHPRAHGRGLARTAARREGADWGDLRVRCSTLHSSHSACVRDVLELLSIDAHAMALGRHEEALRHSLPHPDDPVDGGRIRQQAHGCRIFLRRRRSDSADHRSVCSRSACPGTLQACRTRPKGAARTWSATRLPGRAVPSPSCPRQGEPSGRCRWS